ncbi:MAG: hypothetical protein H6Q73_1847 [Firmicutes bacterium]|nr:hypothetical protein [Bacillota bacterium]
MCRSGYIIILVGLLVWNKLHAPVPVIIEIQAHATTSAGVEQAATVAQVPISSTQAVTIANAIKDDVVKSPVSVAQTSGERLETTVKTELQKSGGQFAIVTDAKQPATTPALPKISSKITSAAESHETILPNTPVTLNQYNIKAYPDRLIQIDGSYQEVMAAYSWKVNVPKIPIISPHGDVGYLGVYGHANLDNPAMSRVGVMLTIPR